MKKKWVVVRLEISTREFQSKSLLAYNLIAKGYGVVIKHDIADNVKILPKGVYLINSIYKNSCSQLKKIFSSGNKIFCLDEESLVIRNEDEYLRRLPEENLKLLSVFFCTGQKHYETIRKGNRIDETKLIISGNPRINVLDKKFDSIESRNVSKIQENYGKFILIVSNFGTVNVFGSDTSRQARYDNKYNTFIRQGLLPDAQSKIDFENRFDHYEYIFESFLSLVRNIGENHLDINLVIRPHPAEDQKIWRHLAKKFKNIKVIYEGNLTEWIKASSVVVQNGCTSSMEALILNKPCISYRPIVDDKYDQLLPSMLSVNIYNCNDLIDAIKFCLHEGSLTSQVEIKKFKSILSEYVSHHKDDDSIKKIIEAIDNEEIEPDNFNILNRFMIYCSGAIDKIKFNLKYSIAMYLLNFFDCLGVKKWGYNYLKSRTCYAKLKLEEDVQKRNGLSSADFDNIFSIYNDVYGFDLNIKTSCISDGAFKIECKN